MMLSDFQGWVAGRWNKNPRRDDLAIMTLGLCGEAGEVSEPIKKQIRGSKPVDVAALALELGDVIHYATAIANHFGIDMEAVLEQNVKKIEAREAAKPDLYSRLAPTAFPKESC
jgi:NTP pyrophosphatase (non-canonical NTP hydrolase)